MKTIAIFCGSSTGSDPVYAASAKSLATCMLEANIDLVYGGASIGLMGILADTILAGGGEVYGVMPTALIQREIAHPGLTEAYVVDTLHERKAKMAELADAFVALPGGAGTLDEWFEAWTWGLLGYHQKPCGLLNVAGYYDALLQQIQHMAQSGFVAPAYLDMLVIATKPVTLLQGLQSYQPPPPKWSV